MNRPFWKNKKVLLTGHTGFKGSWLSLWLQRMGAEVTGYALAPPTNPSLFHIARVDEGMTSITADVRDLSSFSKCIKQCKPEIVIHMAALSLVRYSYEHPVDTYSTNVMGTVNVLDAVRRSDSVRAAIIITSDKCYQNKEWMWGYREIDPMGGHDPYSSSKGCAELVATAYRKSFFSDNQCRTLIATTRAGNVVGGGDWAKDRLIPDIIRSYMKGRSVVIRYPAAIRPWQYVLEPLHGYLLLAEKLWNGGRALVGPWNFGPRSDDARPVSWVTDRLAQLWGEGSSWERDTESHPHEAAYLKLDCSKARNMLGWAPVVDLEDTLARIVNWYRAYSEHADMRDYTESELSSYEKLLPNESMNTY